MNGTLLPGYVERIATRKDKSVAITLGTQELTPAKAGELFEMQDKLVAIYLSPKDSIPQKELDQVDQLNPEFGGKTQSQRLRNVLYKLFEQNKEGFKDFESFYKHHTEKIIDHFKTKINP